ncbi:MAG: phosphoribosylformylglycinamidine synthase I [Chloroflexi bacterium]|nr:phosphoribosylformylglycinamidine synthase I [Chloroflexota bacterium]
MRVAVVTFPGTNCEQETVYVLGTVLGGQAEAVWHETGDLSGFDAVVLPGGFAHGDHLRAGAIARFSPVMAEVARFAREDRLVLGICNGLQILLEAGLLPGAMQRNASLCFRSVWCYVRVESTHTPFTRGCEIGEVLHLPVAHNEGNYVVASGTLARMERHHQIVLRYAGERGERGTRYNPNGSLDDIAGICSEGGNVFGLMPHPERAAERILGSDDGLKLLSALAPVGAHAGGR